MDDKLVPNTQDMMASLDQRSRAGSDQGLNTFEVRSHLSPGEEFVWDFPKLFKSAFSAALKGEHAQASRPCNTQLHQC